MWINVITLPVSINVITLPVWTNVITLPFGRMWLHYFELPDVYFSDRTEDAHQYGLRNSISYQFHTQVLIMPKIDIIHIYMHNIYIKHTYKSDRIMNDWVSHVIKRSESKTSMLKMVS